MYIYYIQGNDSVLEEKRERVGGNKEEVGKIGG